MDVSSQVKAANPVEYPKGDSPRAEGSGSRKTNIPVLETPGQIHFEQLAGESGVVLRVCGEVDDFSAQELRLRLQVLRERTPGGIQLDLERMTYINSSGVAVLAQAWRAMQRDRRPFSMVRAPASVRTIFRALGLERLLD